LWRDCGLLLCSYIGDHVFICWLSTEQYDAMDLSQFAVWILNCM
jgi:hypothetical protein